MNGFNRMFEIAGRLDRAGIALTRVGLVVLVWIGGLKAFPYEDEGIVPFVANSPFMSFVYKQPVGEYRHHMTPEGESVPGNVAWHAANGTDPFAYALGSVIVLYGVMIALHPVFPRTAAVGSFFVAVMSSVTLSFLVTTPECWLPSHGSDESGFPLLAGPGRLVVKNAIMLGAAVVTMADSAKAYQRKRHAAVSSASTLSPPHAGGVGVSRRALGIAAVAVAVQFSVTGCTPSKNAEPTGVATSQSRADTTNPAPPAGGQGTEAVAISDCKLPHGYRDWKLISVAREEGELDDIRAVLGNDVANTAARDGARPFPDGAVIARIAWGYVPSEENNKTFGRPQSFVAGPPKNGVQIMVKDSTKYAATGGWGFFQFDEGKPAGAAVLNSCSSLAMWPYETVTSSSLDMRRETEGCDRSRPSSRRRSDRGAATL